MGCTSNQQVVKRRMAVRSHHDVVCSDSFCLIDDMLDGGAVELHRFSGNALLLQYVLESGEIFGGGLFAGCRNLGHIFH